VSAALIVTSLLLLYYLLLDIPLGLAMGAVFALMLWGAEPLSQASLGVSLAWFLVLFVVGWALQLWGHVYEGRKPALVDNLFQIFVAPIFLAAEVFFALGYRPRLHEAVQRRALEMRAQAGVPPERRPEVRLIRPAVQAFRKGGVAVMKLLLGLSRAIDAMNERIARSPTGWCCCPA
jgi:uncharacterized membrane protein YGL010W